MNNFSVFSAILDLFTEICSQNSEGTGFNIKGAMGTGTSAPFISNLFSHKSP